MPRKNHGPGWGLCTGDDVNLNGRNGYVSAPIPGSEPDACWIRFEDGGYERHDSHTLADNHTR